MAARPNRDLATDESIEPNDSASLYHTPRKAQPALGFRRPGALRGAAATGGGSLSDADGPLLLPLPLPLPLWPPSSFQPRTSPFERHCWPWWALRAGTGHDGRLDAVGTDLPAASAGELRHWGAAAALPAHEAAVRGILRWTACARHAHAAVGAGLGRRGHRRQQQRRRGIQRKGASTAFPDALADDDARDRQRGACGSIAATAHRGPRGDHQHDVAAAAATSSTGTHSPAVASPPPCVGARLASNGDPSSPTPKSSAWRPQAATAPPDSPNPTSPSPPAAAPASAGTQLPLTSSTGTGPATLSPNATPFFPTGTPRCSKAMRWSEESDLSDYDNDADADAKSAPPSRGSYLDAVRWGSPEHYMFNSHVGQAPLLQINLPTGILLRTPLHTVFTTWPMQQAACMLMLYASSPNSETTVLASVACRRWTRASAAEIMGVPAWLQAHPLHDSLPRRFRSVSKQAEASVAINSASPNPGEAKAHTRIHWCIHNCCDGDEDQLDPVKGTRPSFFRARPCKGKI
ncbi:unnamed protein product [Miscanthus lutarioriparius]|uniref:Uncharacterized protein n=1 Tax=Miscanthus lutarioriparius TaxID=422564 RepID=A0A811MMS1_9POAL|nr:unnamed protein product [Miscanthus lutarioriparius]